MPAYEFGDVTVGVVLEFVAEGVGEFPFFDLGPGSHMEAFVEAGERGGDIGGE